MNGYDIVFHEDSFEKKISKHHKRKSDHEVSNKNYLEVKPGALLWEEESMTFSRDEGANLIQLQRENAELRNRLKNLSQKINQRIDTVEIKRKKQKLGKRRDINNEIETAEKKLGLYK